MLLDARLDASAYWWTGIQEGTIAFQANDGVRAWFFVTYASSVAVNACAGGYMVLADVPEDPVTDVASYSQGASATCKITQEAPNVGDVLEGTFSAELKSVIGALSVSVTEGSFRVPRIAEPPF